MVNTVRKEGGFFCDLCKMKFSKKEHALECEEHCKKTKSCNLNIIEKTMKW